jgi:hypothetical protein
MDNKNTPKEPKEKRNAAEKPVSLWGASFTDVLGALLKTNQCRRRIRNKVSPTNRLG